MSRSINVTVYCFVLMEIEVLRWQLVETSEEVLKMGRGPSQYYATVDLGETRVGRTRVLAGSKDPKDPVWNEKFRIYCAHTISHVIVSIKDAAIVGTTVVGRAKVPVLDLLSGNPPPDHSLPLHMHFLLDLQTCASVLAT